MLSTFVVGHGETLVERAYATFSPANLTKAYDVLDLHIRRMRVVFPAQQIQELPHWIFKDEDTLRMVEYEGLGCPLESQDDLARHFVGR